MNQAYSVSQLNAYIGRLFSKDFILKGITVKGEISNLKYHSSGHIYFTLKDDGSQISGIMFLKDREGLSFSLKNGMSVLCTGTIGVYERNGSYQIYAREFSLTGVGELYARYEELKKKLYEMGMFDPIYKKEIPEYAGRIGVVTARTGAAIRDIIQISKRRNPYVEIVLFPAKVQGEGAAQEIKRGIETLDRLSLDLIIVGRGGGSIEDLWAFNEEIVARAIFDCQTPVISAVGHETDTTIADFVADLRAPTPSGAAELANFDFSLLLKKFAQYKETLSRILLERLSEKRQILSMKELLLSQRSPGGFVLKSRIRLKEDGKIISDIMMSRLNSDLLRKERISLSPIMARKLSEWRMRLRILAEQLDRESPLKKLGKGFAYLEAGGKAVNSVRDLSAGLMVDVTLRDGHALMKVENSSIQEGDNFEKEKGASCRK